MRLPSPILLAIVLLIPLAARPAAAETTPLPGAVSFPADVPLALPFPAGYEVRILSGYGPAMGSSLHDGLANTGSANDYYALDLVYHSEPNAGKGLPIVAPLAGEVVKAGWASGGWANYGLRVILRHDLGDGHVYHTIYCHLNAIDPAIAEGSVVAAGQVLGELGQSCQGELSCGSFSTPHLHWAIHRDSLIGGSGTGGSYGGQAVVPEPLDGAEDLQQDMVITSTNTGRASCGDGICGSGEDHGSCAGDCPPCTLLPAAGGVVDDSERPCFVAGGTPSYWHEEPAGWMDGLKWTTATDAARPDNHGIWRLAFQQAGDYHVEVHTVAAFADSEMAAYAIHHGRATDDVAIDQTAVDGWQSLGHFSFAEGGDQWVRLDDNTGEPIGEARKLVFDAVRLTALGAGGGTAQAGSGGGAVAASGGGGGVAAGMAPADGCGCRAAAPRPRGAFGALLVAALALATRRRARRR